MKINTKTILSVVFSLLMITSLYSCNSTSDGKKIDKSESNKVLENAPSDENLSNKDKSKEANPLEHIFPNNILGSDFDVESKSFKKNKEIYEYFVSIVQHLVRENSITNEHSIGFLEYNERYFLEFRDVSNNTDTRFETDKKTFDKYVKLHEIYYEMGNYSFIGLRYVNDYLQFEAEHGEYILIYAFDGVSPRKKNYQNYNDRSFDVEHIEGNWYQMKQ